MNPSTPTLTEATSLKGTGRISKTVGYYAAFIALGLVTASLGPTLPGLAENTRSQLGEISFLFTTRSLGTCWVLSWEDDCTTGCGVIP